MDAKGTNNQDAEHNNDDDNQDYGKLFAVIAIVVVVGFIFLSVFGGVITFFENLSEGDKNTKSNQFIIKQLRDLASEANSRIPIRINDDTIITSVAVSESATFIFRVLSTNLTASDVENNNVADEVKRLTHGMACNNKVLLTGLKEGASMRFVMTTIDGYEIDSGLINSSSCN